MDGTEFPVYGYDDAGNLISSRMHITIYDKRLYPKQLSLYKDRIAVEFMEKIGDGIHLNKLLRKLIYDKNIKPILSFLRKDDWRSFSNLYMKTRFSNPVQYTFKDLTPFDWSIINNKNFIVDADTVRRGNSSELYLTKLPDEILVKMDYKSVYTIIDMGFDNVDTNIFRYKFYEALHYMFPENKGYWKGYMFYTSNNGDGTTKDFLDNFAVNENVNKRNIGSIFRNFIYKLNKEDIKINQYSTLGEFYNNNIMRRFEYYNIEEPPIPYKIEDNKIIFNIYGIVDNILLSSVVEIYIRDKIFMDNEVIKPLNKNGLRYLLQNLQNCVNLNKIFGDILSWSDNLGKIIPFVGNNKSRWEILVDNLILHMKYVDKRKLRDKKYKRDLLYILNNDNVVINEKTLDRNRTTNITNYPGEFILKFNHEIIYKLLQPRVHINIDILKYKIYEFLYKVYPNNVDYWKYISTTKFDKNELLPSTNESIDNINAENFAKQLLAGIKAENYKDLLYKIITFLTYNTTGNRGSNIGQCYKNNKEIIDTTDLSYIDSMFGRESIIERLNRKPSVKTNSKYNRYYDSEEDYDDFI